MDYVSIEDNYSLQSLEFMIKAIDYPANRYQDILYSVMNVLYDVVFGSLDVRIDEHNSLSCYIVSAKLH